MRILGIDPGSRFAGFGLIETDGRKFRYLDSGTLKYDEKLSFMMRLRQIHHSCVELVTKYQPDEIALESLIYVKSVSSLSKLAQARGAMIAALLTKHTGELFEYSPNLVKMSVCGDGHASKEGIQKSLQMILGTHEFLRHDESDALAVAICHVLNRRNALAQNSVDMKPRRRMSLQQICKKRVEL